MKAVYRFSRRTVLHDFVPERCVKVLDVGCGTGELGAALKELNPRREVTGIEINEGYAAVARTKLDCVCVLDAEQSSLESIGSSGQFDCIIFADVLEHMRQPWAALKRFVKYLDEDDGVVVASIPNVRHWSTIAALLWGGYWPYRSEGVHDITHLRFFTIKNVLHLFEQADLSIVRHKRVLRLTERPSYYNPLFARVLEYLPLPGIKDFLTFQNVVQARKNPSTKS